MLAAVLGNVAFLLLGLSVLGIVVILAMATMRTPASSVAGATQSRASASNASNRPPGGDWITLRSTAPADIIAAARRSELFNEHGNPSGDHVANVSRIGTPIFVRALQPADATAGEYPDFYVLPILDNKGAVTDAAELVLDPKHTAIQVIAIVTYTQPHAQGAIPLMNAATAQTALTAQQHMTLRAGTTPVLVYFPADATAQETGQTMWTSGGTFPADPIWLIAGTDGGDYVIGTDGRVYDIAQLPMAHDGP